MGYPYYRSSRTILEAANAVIANNKQRHGKTLWSDHAAGLRECLVRGDEADMDPAKLERLFLALA